MDAYPGDEEMQVSHETIYQLLFIQGKGALRKGLWRCLRTLGSQGESGVDLANGSSWSGR
jgi:IS30 family transposase